MKKSKKNKKQKKKRFSNSVKGFKTTKLILEKSYLAETFVVDEFHGSFTEYLISIIANEIRIQKKKKKNSVARLMKKIPFTRIEVPGLDGILEHNGALFIWKIHGKIKASDTSLPGLIKKVKPFIK